MQEYKPSKLLLYVLILILVVSVVFGGVYLAKDKNYSFLNNNVVKTTTNTSTETTTNSGVTGPSQKPNVDAEIKSMDAAVDAIGTNDFSDDTLSDSQLGL